MTNDIPDVRFTPLGGANEIAANSFLLEFGSVSLLIDSGSKVEGEGWDNLPDWNLLRRAPDAIIVTHAHNDHVGSLLPLMARYKDVPVYMTPATANLMMIVLADQNKLLNARARRNEAVPYMSVVNEFTANPSLFKDRFKQVNYGETFSIKDLTLRFRDAGHIKGSAMLEVYDAKFRVLHTGDYCAKKTVIEAAADFSGLEGKVDWLISEATYGASGAEHFDREQAVADFAAQVSAILRRKGGVLIPAFAAGKTQEVLAVISALKNACQIDGDIPVYVAGLGARITKCVYDDMTFDYKVLEHKQIQDVVAHVAASGRGAIFIMTSGFLAPQTHSHRVFDMIKSNPNWGVVFPSLFAHKQQARFTDGVSCRIGGVDFSAHAKAVDIIGVVKKIKPKLLTFVHGDRSAIRTISDAARTRGWRSAVDGLYEIYSPAVNGDTVYTTKHAGKVYLQGSSSLDAVIITVGTSLRTNSTARSLASLDEVSLYNLLCEDPARYSAELNTLRSVKTDRHTRCFLLSSDNPDGLSCANVIARYLCERRGINAEVVIVAGLTKEASRFKTEGLPNLISEIARIIARFRDTKLVVTGGFKAVTAYANIAGVLFGKEVYYQHEDFTSVINMPVLPIGLDFSYYSQLRAKMKSIINAETLSKAKTLLPSIPDTYQSGFLELDAKSKRYVQTPLGVLMDKVCAYNEQRREQKIEGEPLGCVSSGAPVSSKEILSGIQLMSLRLKLEMILGQPYVESVRFEDIDIKTLSKNIQQKLTQYRGVGAYMWYARRKGADLTYLLKYNNAAQYVHVKVKRGVEGHVRYAIGDFSDLTAATDAV